MRLNKLSLLNNNLPMPLPLTNGLTNAAINAKARLILAHGAGAAANSAFMNILAAALSRNHIEVWRFNFNYMQRFIVSGKRTLPDKLSLLTQQFEQIIQQAPTDLPLFIAGKSMGGRVASLLSNTANVKAVFAFGYPFHAPGKNSWRTEHFNKLGSPLFIAQGERDAFGNKEELATYHWPGVTLCWLADGDHDFKPRVKSGLTQLQLIDKAGTWCSRKIDDVLLANE